MRMVPASLSIIRRAMSEIDGLRVPDKNFIVVPKGG